MRNDLLNSIRVVLCEPHHPGNIGATARAMKNMGLTRLTLVAPKAFPSAQATERASGADDVLNNATVVETLEQAISDCAWVFGTSSREREFPWPQLPASHSAQKILEYAKQNQEIAILFGTERTGLTNAQLQVCDYHITIPTHPDYPSLNLASAVQVISYEIYQAYLNLEVNINPKLTPNQSYLFEKANGEDIAGLLKHAEQTAIALGFMDPNNPKKLLPRIKRLISKAQLEKEEVNIIRGFLKAILEKI